MEQLHSDLSKRFKALPSDKKTPDREALLQSVNDKLDSVLHMYPAQNDYSQKNEYAKCADKDCGKEAPMIEMRKIKELYYCEEHIPNTISECKQQLPNWHILIVV